jgi:peroxiredoxin Q/BCP
LRDGYDKLLSKGIKVLGVSADSVKSHDKFSSKFSLPFPLLADEAKELINSFGVWGPKKFMGREYEGIHRLTFVIDENGLIMHVIQKPKTKDHANEILDLLELQ